MNSASPTLSLTPSRILGVLAMTHPTPHFALKPPCTIHSRHYFRVQLSTWESAASIFHVSLSPPEDHSPPAPLQQCDLGEYQGPGLNDCFFFLVKFRGLSNVPTGLSLPPLPAFPQSTIISSHIPGTAFVERGTKESMKPAANCRRSQRFSGGSGVIGVVTTVSRWAHVGLWEEGVLTFLTLFGRTVYFYLGFALQCGHHRKVDRC